MEIKLNDPGELGFSSGKLGRINAGMQRYVDQNLIAGIVTLVARRGGVVHFEKFGRRDIENQKPMEFDTIFRIYSMTKPITSVIFMMLFEENRVRLEDPVSKFIPEFKQVKVLEKGGALVSPGREVTMHDLLTHTAGLSYGDEEDSLIDKLYRQADIFSPTITLQEMVRHIAEVPLRHHPGQAWYYSVATDVIGYVVELIYDIPLADVFEEKIYKPLGLVDTSFNVPPEKVDRFAVLYGPTDESPLSILDDEIGGDYFNTKLHSGGGGLVSTTADYLRFAQCIANKGELDGVRLLGTKTVELMTANHLPPSLLPIAMSGVAWPGFGFGLGFSVMMDVALSGMMGSVGTHGWGGYANTHFWVDPLEEIIGILMPQYLPSGTYPITNDFRTLVYQAMIE